MSHLIERALGTIHFATDCIPAQRRSKIAELDAATTEGKVEILAALVFDLYRKLEYVHAATRPFADDADRELTRQVASDWKRAFDHCGEDIDWAALRSLYHDRMMALYSLPCENHMRSLAGLDPIE